MFGSFQRSIGASADLKELEYISALHQTDRELRSEGSINSEDIRCFLRSRYGIVIDAEDSRHLLSGLKPGVRKCTNLPSINNTGNIETDHQLDLDLGKVITVDSSVTDEYLHVDKSTESESDRVFSLDLIDTIALIFIPFLRELRWKHDFRVASSDTCIEVVWRSMAQVLNSSSDENSENYSIKEILIVLLRNLNEDELVEKLELLPEFSDSSIITADFSPLSLLLALTDDLIKWNTCKDTSFADAFEDVFGEEKVEDNVSIAKSESSHQKSSVEGDNIDTIDFKELKDHRIQLVCHPVLPSIDFVVDTFRSIIIVVIIWLFYISTTLSYLSVVIDKIYPEMCLDKTDFFCKLADTILVWITFAIILSAAGVTIIFPLSLANLHIESVRNISISFLALAIYTFVPYFIVLSQIEELTVDWTTRQISILRIFMNLNLVIGSCLIVLTAIHLVFKMSANHFLRKLSSPGRCGAQNQKLSCKHKVGKLIHSALMLHESTTSICNSSQYQDFVMNNFVSRGEVFQECGGLIWTWKNIFSGKLFTEDGVWIHCRLVTAQVAQLITGLILYIVLSRTTDQTADNIDKTRHELLSHLADEDLTVITWVERFVPEKWMIIWSSYPAMTISIIVTIIQILMYMPSTVSTILKLRCGYQPSLRDPRMPNYRLSADTICYNLGNMIYALLGSGVLFWMFWTTVLFLFYWPVTQDFMFIFLAWLLGLSITIAAKFIILKTCRLKYYQGFYRKLPASANISSILLECWHLGVGGGVLLSRLFQFFLAAVFWIGRVDIAFLSEEVSVFGYVFDATPFHFRKEIMAHEAHRHPYIERIGAVYMMKMKYGKEFCSERGNLWRRLFVLHLMPWTIKYKIPLDNIRKE